MTTQNLSSRVATTSVPTYSPGANAGIVPVSGLPGIVSGASIPTGYVGEIVSYTDSTQRSLTATTAAYVDVTSATITLSAGIWQILGQLTHQFGAPSGSADVDGIIASTAIRTSSGTVVAETVTGSCTSGVTEAFGGAPVVATVNITSSTAYKLSVYCRSIQGTATTNQNLIRGDFQTTRIYAVRIA